MVREMIDEEGKAKTLPSPPPQHQQPVHRSADKRNPPRDAAAAPAAPAVNTPNTPSTMGGQVVQATGARGGSTTYVGATHFMAMLDDVRKCAFALLSSSFTSLLIGMTRSTEHLARRSKTSRASSTMMVPE